MTRAILWIAVSSGRQAEDDKESLPEQDRRLGEIAQTNSWSIVDTITVPGHSRVYYNYREFAEAALEQDIDSPMRMFEHWQRKDFDVLACIDGSRFGREQSIFAEVVARTTDINAQIFTLKDGYIHTGNRRMYVSMAGYAAATEIDELKRRRKFGFEGRAERGLKVSARTLFGFREIRDEKGQVIRQEPDPEYSRIFEKVAAELLNGTPWSALGKTLNDKYNLVNPSTGKPFIPRFFFSIMSSATFWGHTAINYRNADSGQHFSHWIYDETLPVPAEVKVYRHTHQPIYAGEISDRVKAEIRRRRDVVAGRAIPEDTHKFSGLIICDECGSHLCFNHKRGSRYASMRCQEHWRGDCSQNKTINIKKVQFRVNEVLKMLKEGGFSAVFKVDESLQDRVDRLQQQMELARTSMNHLMIALQSVEPGHPAFAMYTEKIKGLGDNVQAQEKELSMLHAKQHTQAQKQAKREIRQLDLNTFWSLSEKEINQRLHRIFNPYKFFVREGEIINLAEYSGRRSPRQKYLV